jgi:hypothetical protein
MVPASKPTPEFLNLLSCIKRILPACTIFFILVSYLVIAILNSLFLPFHWTLSLLTGIIISFGRFLMIFTEFLSDSITKNNNQWQKIVAGILTIIGLIELYLSLKTFYPDQFVPVFLNIGAIIILGYALELSFLEKSRYPTETILTDNIKVLQVEDNKSNFSQATKVS